MLFLTKQLRSKEVESGPSLNRHLQRTGNPLRIVAYARPCLFIHRIDEETIGRILIQVKPTTCILNPKVGINTKVRPKPPQFVVPKPSWASCISGTIKPLPLRMINPAWWLSVQPWSMLEKTTKPIKPLPVVSIILGVYPGIQRGSCSHTAKTNMT